MIPDAKRTQIILLTRDGISVAEVARRCHVSRPTVYKVLKEGLPADMDPGMPQPNGKKTPELPASVEVEDSGLQKTIFDKAVKTAGGRAAGSLADDIAGDYLQYLEDAKILKRYSMKWQSELEEAGIEWTSFIEWCLEQGYTLVQREIFRQILMEEQHAKEVTIEDMVKARVQVKMMRG